MGLTRGEIDDIDGFWQSSYGYSASMDVPDYWTAGQVQRLLDALASHNRHQARTAALIMWRTGLRVSEPEKLPEGKEQYMRKNDGPEG